MLDLSIVLVNYNTRQLLLGCRESIYGRPQGVRYEVIVVDNASSDAIVHYEGASTFDSKTRSLSGHYLNLDFPGLLAFGRPVQALLASARLPGGD